MPGIPGYYFYFSLWNEILWELENAMHNRDDRSLPCPLGMHQTNKGRVVSGKLSNLSSYHSIMLVKNFLSTTSNLPTLE